MVDYLNLTPGEQRVQVDMLIQHAGQCEECEFRRAVEEGDEPIQVDLRLEREDSMKQCAECEDKVVWMPDCQKCAKKLHSALEWLTNLGCGLGKRGGDPEPGEFEDALDQAKSVLAACEEKRDD